MPKKRTPPTPLQILIKLMNNVSSTSKASHNALATINGYEDQINGIVVASPEYQDWVECRCPSKKGAIEPFPYHLALDKDERPQQPREFNGAVAHLINAAYYGAVLRIIDKIEDKRPIKSGPTNDFMPVAHKTHEDMRTLRVALTYASATDHQDVEDLKSLRKETIARRNEEVKFADAAIKLLSSIQAQKPGNPKNGKKLLPK